MKFVTIKYFDVEPESHSPSSVTLSPQKRLVWKSVKREPRLSRIASIRVQLGEVDSNSRWTLQGQPRSRHALSYFLVGRSGSFLFRAERDLYREKDTLLPSKTLFCSEAVVRPWERLRGSFSFVVLCQQLSGAFDASNRIMLRFYGKWKDCNRDRGRRGRKRWVECGLCWEITRCHSVNGGFGLYSI